MSILMNLFQQVLEFFYSFCGDWGITTVLTTIAIRAFLVPISIYQKRKMAANAELSAKIQTLKDKYGNDKQKLQSEMLKLTSENKQSFLGLLLTLIQFPIMYGLYRAFSGMNVEIGSLIVPWITNLKLPDATFIVPMMTAVIQMIPNLLMQMEAIKSSRRNGLSFGQIALMGVLNLLFLAKAPVTLGIYWFTSGVLNLLEYLAYSILKKRFTPVKEL